jgi:hypothetical protein
MSRSYAVLLVVLSAVALATACGPDRFVDSGCESDDDCRGDRMCVEGLCLGDNPNAGDASSDTSEDGESESDVIPGDDAQMADVGSGEDAGSADLEPFLGQWETEGPIDVVDEEGRVVQQLEPQRLVTQVERAAEADLGIAVEALQGCEMRADVVGPERFVVRQSSCERNPIEQVPGPATITEGTGVLSVNQTILEFAFTIQIESPDLGVVNLEFLLAGPRTEF